jgi:hypothetical protein
MWYVYSVLTVFWLINLHVRVYISVWEQIHMIYYFCMLEGWWLVYILIKLCKCVGGLHSCAMWWQVILLRPIDPWRCRHYVPFKLGELISQRCSVMLLKNGVLSFVFFVLTLVNGVICSCVNIEELVLIKHTEFDINLWLWLFKHLCNHFVHVFFLFCLVMQTCFTFYFNSQILSLVSGKAKQAFSSHIKLQHWYILLSYIS